MVQTGRWVDVCDGERSIVFLTYVAVQGRGMTQVRNAGKKRRYQDQPSQRTPNPRDRHTPSLSRQSTRRSRVGVQPPLFRNFHG